MALLRCAATLAVVALVSLRHGQAPTGLTEAQAKAAVLYNLAQFVEWPSDASGSTLTIGLIRAASVLTAIQGAEGRLVHGRTVRIREMQPGDDAHVCQIVYIPDLDREGQAWLERVARKPILTVSDDERFLRAGGMIRLSFVDARVKFDIDVGHAERAGLKISSKVLTLARVVRDGREIK
jgi:YfiR/HmsC-like